MLRKVFFMIVALLLCSCTPQDVDYSLKKIKRDPIDREANLTREEIKYTVRPYDTPLSKEIYKDNDLALVFLQKKSKHKI